MAGKPMDEFGAYVVLGLSEGCTLLVFLGGRTGI